MKQWVHKIPEKCDSIGCERKPTYYCWWKGAGTFFMCHEHAKETQDEHMDGAPAK